MLASEYVTDALDRAGYLSNGDSVEPEDLNRGVVILNDFMLELEAGPIQLGFTPISAVEDEVTIPPGANRFVKARLAKLLSSEHGLPIDPILIEEESESFKNVLAAYGKPVKQSLPRNLPLGAGNNYTPGHVYPNPDKNRNF